VDQLGGATDREANFDGRIGRARGQHGEQRSQALATREQEVLAHRGDRADVALHALLEHDFQLLELGPDQAREVVAVRLVAAAGHGRARGASALNSVGSEVVCHVAFLPFAARRFAVLQSFKTN
jgi:hypothetical protein